jgi:ABC-type transporter Mla MlaB component
MTKEDEQGLLSRMVRFVRSPSASWSELDQSDLDSESRYSRQMLKDMIERRRRNDFVRKREFDMLRKLRRDSLIGAQEGSIKASAFPNSQQNKPDERAKTIKKIDEIEAQMSQQWWKTKYGNSDQKAEARDNPNTDFSVSFPNKLDGPVGKGPRPSSAPGKSRPPHSSQQKAALDSSEFQSTQIETPDDVERPLQAVRMSEIASLAAHGDGHTQGFSHSKLNAFQVAEFTHDPLLEEAAIRFANGDDDGAEAALLEALRNPDPAINGNQTIWMTLFDLYRATDRQGSFESVSLDFANRFGRSAPLWISIPESARMHQPKVQEAPREFTAHWKSPVVVDTKSLVALRAKLDKAPQPWCLNWVGLASVDTAALDGLLKLVTTWTDQTVKLRFTGAENLLLVLKAATVSGEQDVDQLWWKLRMQVLRIMHRPAEFEEVALDYCVTYEVSPPSWESALCDFKTDDGTGSATAPLSRPPTLVGESLSDGLSSTLPPADFTEHERSALAALGGNVSAVDLSGHIMGDAVEMLDALNAKLESADLIVVLCARLVRLDFLAAGALLNWVSARQAEGRHVQFKDLHRLVAVFFNVIGINEHAKVTPRTD